MTYEEFLEMLKESGIEGIDQYTSAAKEAYDDVTAGANARITELETENAELGKRLQETQARNYVLMTAATSKVGEPGDRDKPDEPSESDRDVHSLFAN